MRIVVIGAGALGGSYGGRLALAGAEVCLVDRWDAHVAAIREGGLRLSGVQGDANVKLPASTGAPAGTRFDLAIIATDANNTQAASELAAGLLAEDGAALPLQNGIGNVETLVATLGAGRVLGGSSMSSFMVQAPGHVVQTHAGPTTIGECHGATSPRLQAIRDLLTRAGFETRIAPDIMATIWQKFLVNVAINPICAVTGLRLGELARHPAVSAFQDCILDEALAVTKAKGIRLPDPEIVKAIKQHCWSKYSRPSMLQHIDAGRSTEIDALNGALVREAQALGVPVPFNEALTALVKGREQARIIAVSEPDRDYDAMERAIEA